MFGHFGFKMQITVYIIYNTIITNYLTTVMKFS